MLGRVQLKVSSSIVKLLTKHSPLGVFDLSILFSISLSLQVICNNILLSALPYYKIHKQIGP